MVKKVITLMMGLAFSMGTMAQMGPGNPTVPQSAIQFWTGTGSNRAVIAVTWEDDSEDYIGIAWGVQWNGGSIMLASLMDTIAAYDSRVTLSGSTSFITNIAYNDSELGLNLIGVDSWWWYNWKNAADQLQSSGGVTYDMIQNGDFVDWMQMGAADTMLMATDPNALSVTEATIAQSDILYWVGEGANQVVMAVNWPDPALAWGYRFDGSKTVSDMMNDIASADPRFSIVPGSYGIDDILFVENGDTLRRLATSWWGSTNNGVMDMGMGQPLANGDFEKWADGTTGVLVDSVWVEDLGGYWSYNYVYPMTIHPVSAPSPEEATIAASAIEYWVGEGANQVVMAVNWPDTALAWGYRFDGSKTVSDMMNDIASADPRFSIVPGSYGIDDILFVENGDTLRRLATSWWGSTNNGVMDMGMGQPLANGDFEKWADGTTGVWVDSVWVEDFGGYWNQIYVYPMEIHAASQPFGYGPFSGIVNTEGCEAIAYNSSDIKAWATACTLVRGSQNLSNPEAPVVTYGTEQDAVGAASTNNMAVVSLGDGGMATLTFAKPIANGDGPDFAVFENSFDDYFLELAFVEVSSDGERFVRFPATSLTQTARQIGGSGCVDATYINNLAGKYRAGYGTPFDLDELADSTGLDINAITHVRIVDVIGSIDPQYATYDAFGHMVNDPFPTISYSAGFDLDGVAVLHEGTVGVDDVALAEVSLYPNPVSDLLTISGAAGSEASLYDMTGRLMGSWQVSSDSWQLGTADLKSGVYMLRVGENTYRIVKK